MKKPGGEELAENNEILCQMLYQGWDRLGMPVTGIECLRPGHQEWTPCPTKRHVLLALGDGAILRRERKVEP
jgi:hypothetical protein